MEAAATQTRARFMDPPSLIAGRERSQCEWSILKGAMKLLQRYLLPNEETHNPAFRSEVGRLSVTGLRVIAAIGVGANLLSYLLWLLWLPELPSWMLSSDAVGILIVAAGLALTFWRGFRPHARWVCLLLLFAGFSDQIVAAVGKNDLPVEMTAFVPILVTMTLLLAVTALPVKPLQTLALGGGLTAVFFWAAYGPRRYLNLSFQEAFPVSVLIIVVLMATALTAVLYQQRVAAFHGKHAAEEALEALRRGAGEASDLGEHRVAEPLRRRALPRAQYSSRGTLELVRDARRGV